MRLAAVLLAAALALPAMAEDRPATLSVTGQGSASAAPDMATVRLGVETQAAEPAEAMQQNTAAVEAILAKITGAGIEEKDVQTTNLSVFPVYDHRRQQQEGGPPVLTGFRVTNEVVARIRDLDSLGSVLASVVDAGANRINGLSFGIDDETPLRNQARTSAVEDARATAELLAEAAGVELTRIMSISADFRGPVPMPAAAPMMRMEMAQSDAVPIQRGESTLDATVHIVWEIAPKE